MPDGPNQAEATLRAQTRAALQAARISQAQAEGARGLSTKHLRQMLTGRAPLTLGWAERILALCGMRLAIAVHYPEESTDA